MTEHKIASSNNHGLKTGLYIDSANLSMNGGFGMRYEILRKFACRGGAMPIRLNAYVSYDPQRGDEDEEYRHKQNKFHATLRDFGYKVIQKNAKWYTDDAGNRYGKANVDLDLAVDALLQSEALDRVVLATGDGDFVEVVRALQNRGCRVEVIAFDNVSGNLRREADLYVSGYLIPHLLPIHHNHNQYEWGDVGSYVRGVCYSHDSTKGFGWLRYLNNINNGDLWTTDYRDPSSPYDTIFCHDSEYPHDLNLDTLTNRKLILEFEIAPGSEADKTKAVKVDVIHAVT